MLDRLGLVSGWAVCSNGSVTLRLDPLSPDGYEVADTVTFDPSNILTLLRENLPTALYALETGAGDFLLTAPFPPGELEARTPAWPPSRSSSAPGPAGWWSAARSTLRTTSWS